MFCLSHLSVDGRLDCFHLLAIMNSAFITIHVNCFSEYLFLVLSAIYLGVELLGHVVILCLTEELPNCS